MIVNLTTWSSVEALAGFVSSGRHLEIMRQRRQWFHRAAGATTTPWWVPSGHRPLTDEAEDRVRQLRRYLLFSRQLHVQQAVPRPQGQTATDLRSSDDWFCQA